MKISNLARTGILTVFSIGILYLGINYLKGKNVFSNLVEYKVSYPRVDGLVRSSAVIIKGFKVGQVSDIEFAKDGSGQLIVNFTIPKDIKLPKNTVAQIISTDLLGTRTIELILAPDHHQYYKAGDTLPSNIEKNLKEQVGMQILPLKNKAEQLMGSLDSAMTVITYIFNKKTRENLRESFQHINSTILNIETTSNDLKELVGTEKYTLAHIINNVDSISSNLRRNSKNLNHITHNLTTFSDSLADLKLQTTISKTAHTLDQVSLILAKINSQDGSIGLLINNPTLYNNLINTNNSLDILLRDIKANPHRYVHFSAFDLGKKVYLSPNSSSKNNVIFKILLISNKTAIVNPTLYFGNVKTEEIKIHNVYFYYTGETKIYSEAIKLKEKMSERFPGAKIVAFKKGKMVALDRALKH